jgi:hypothetical protein
MKKRKQKKDVEETPLHRLTQEIISHCVGHYGSEREHFGPHPSDPGEIIFHEIREALFDASVFFAMVVEDEDHLREHNIDKQVARETAEEFELDDVLKEIDEVDEMVEFVREDDE